MEPTQKHAYQDSGLDGKVPSWQRVQEKHSAWLCYQFNSLNSEFNCFLIILFFDTHESTQWQVKVRQ